LEGTLPGVSGYLVTGRFPHLAEFIASTAHMANWLEGRVPRKAALAGRIEGDSDTTCHVMVPDEFADGFLDLARRLNELPREDRQRAITVEKINGSGDSESYDLLVGEPGTGW
jgi:hypothetical protein